MSAESTAQERQPDRAEELARIEAAEKTMIRAINCLYIAVDSHVAEDVQKKFEAYCLAVRPLLLRSQGASRDIRCGECGELLTVGPCDESTIHIEFHRCRLPSPPAETTK